MKIVVTTVRSPFIHGGAEFQSQQLQKALMAHGHQVEEFAFPFVYNSNEQILDCMLGCSLFEIRCDSVDQVISLKFPAYFIPHPNKVIWLIHQHRQAYDLWHDDTYGGMAQQVAGIEVRDAIYQADKKLFSAAKKVLTTSKNNSTRLKKFCNIDAPALYHPPPYADKFYSAQSYNYFYFPSRISPLKRQNLLIEALSFCKEDVRVIFSGAPDRECFLEDLKSLALEQGVSDRVNVLGYVDEEEKHKLYAESIAVVYLPKDEDYGYVTLEAMLAAKSVITTTDSGEPLEFIKHGETGLVVEPEPQAIAEVLDQLWCLRDCAAKLGRQAHDYYQSLSLSWENVVASLI